MARDGGPAGLLARFFIESKLTPLLVLAALALGLLGVQLTPREEEPQIALPVFDLFVGLPGAEPLEVENRVTIPLEKRMWEVPGVEYVYASSRTGGAIVTARFFVGEETEASLVRLFEKISSGLDEIPAGATFPIIRERTIDDVPVLALTLWSDSLDGFALRRIAAELRRELAALPNVSDIRLIGGHRRIVRVVLDPQRMAGLGLDPGRIADALAAANASSPAGSFQQGGREVLVETGGFLASPEAVAALIVGAPGGRPVRLSQVAEVLDGPAEPTEIVAFVSGARSGTGAGIAGPAAGIAPAVTLAISKRQGADAIRVVEAVQERIALVEGRLVPDGVTIAVTRDYGHTADEKASELLTHLVVAIISVTIVIAFFLGWRGGLVVFISVPVTFALTLFVYYVLGYTLNRVTLFALIFVTGIVVDDSIIVVENIVRHFAMRTRKPLQAAIDAVAEVGNPTILATLTVIAAVLPMAFVRGLMGPYMKPMPIGAALAMTFSLLVALIAGPWFAYRLLRSAPDSGHEGKPGDQTALYRFYRALLAPLLLRPALAWASIGAVALLLLLALALVPLKLVTVKMLPFDNKSEMQVIVDMPEGTTLETTAGVAREIAAALRTVREVTDIQIYAGTAAPVNFNGLVRHYDLRRGPNVADLQVNLLPKHERDAQSHAIAKRVRPAVQEIAARHGANVKIAEIPPGPPVLSTLVAEIYGPDDKSRLALARDVRAIFESTDGVVDVDWLVEADQQRQLVTVNREKASRHGVAVAAVARTLRTLLGGETAGVLHDAREAEEVPIELRLDVARRSSPAALGAVRIASADGSLVPLSELVRFETTVAPRSRHRKNLEPVVYVVGDVAGTAESPVYAILDMSERIEALSLVDGGRVEQFWRSKPDGSAHPALKWDGEWHITYEVFRDLGGAFAIVLVLIYILIIGWFGSFRVPLTMMIAIPLSLVGILPGHWMFGAFFTATSMIGFIALAGIMVRNSVLLIDFVELSLERGVTLAEAVVEAGAVRLRPIALTAGTVVVGAVVILFDPIFQGLAISLMAGEVASLFLSRMTVPILFFISESRKQKHKPRFPTGTTG